MPSPAADLLRNKRLETIHPDTNELIEYQRDLLNRKPALRDVFVDLYSLLLEKEHRYFTSTPGLRVELGAGASILKKLAPEFVISDIKPASHLDMALDAEDMPFEDGSVRTLVGVNCFHHFPDPAAFLQETTRVLHTGGGLILVEPYESALGRFLYKRMFSTETFDMAQMAWDQTTSGPMVGANQALSHNVFVRDRAEFETRFPQLEIVEVLTLPSYLRYLLSGGFNFRQLMPDVMFHALRHCENNLACLQPLLGLHRVYVIRKRER